LLAIRPSFAKDVVRRGTSPRQAGSYASQRMSPNSRPGWDRLLDAEIRQSRLGPARLVRHRERYARAMAEAEIGVFGGSGFYSFLDAVEEVELETPYGPPSAPVAVGEVGGKRVAFLPRHGRRHEWPPAQVPYRANVWAMRELGVQRIIGPCASGALRPELELGAFVVCDQFVDRTWGRDDTFYPGPDAVHVSAADPYCADLRRVLVETARELSIPVRDGGTVVVVQGPRFSTRAESRWFQSQGWDVINMTAYPECHLARELELCYANISMVTDHDVGVEGAEPVDGETVMRVFRENNDRLRELLFAAIPKLGPQPDDACSRALEGARISP
jgi:5'-methylthioadenosine phosphorylase